MRPFRFGSKSILNDRAQRERREQMERERALERDLARDTRRVRLGGGDRILPAIEKDVNNDE